MSFLKRYDGKIVVLASKHCPSCSSLKERVEKDQVMKDKIVFMNVEDDEFAQAVAEEFKVESVPSYFTVNVKRRKAYICKLDDNMNLVEECRQVDVEK